MGCFNQACFISGLDIGYKDDCLLFPLVKTEYEDDTVWRYFKPFCFPIRGKYDHYNSLKNIKIDWNTTALAKYFGISIAEFLAIISDPHERKIEGRASILTSMEAGFVRADVYRLFLKESMRQWNITHEKWRVGAWKAEDAKKFKETMTSIEGGMEGLSFFRKDQMIPPKFFPTCLKQDMDSPVQLIEVYREELTTSHFYKSIQEFQAMDWGLFVLNRSVLPSRSFPQEGSVANQWELLNVIHEAATSLKRIRKYRDADEIS
jgi:hypothetical protein